MKYRITTGPNAFSFHDQSTGISIARGEIKELTPAQFAKTRVKKALLSGHLVQVMDAREPVKFTKTEIKKLDKKLKDMFNGGVEVSKAASNFTLAEAKVVAEFNQLQPEDNDTVATLIHAIYETYESEDDK